MVIYSLLVLLTLIFGYIINNTKSIKGKKLCYCIIFLSLLLVGGLRYDVGIDYLGTYVNVYYLMLQGYEDPRFDIIPTLIMNIVIFLDLHYQVFFLISEFIILYFTFQSIKEQAKDRQLGLFIFICGTLYFASFNIIRQSIAMVLFYYSLRYLEEGKTAKYILINIIGSLFHYSAIMFIPLYFIVNRDFKLSMKMFCLVFFFVCSGFVISNIITILDFTKYGKYVHEADIYTSFEKLNFSTILNIGLWLCYELYFILSKKKSRKDVIYSNIHFCGVMSTILGFYLPLGIRLFSYFRYIEFLSIPNLISKINGRYRILIKFIAITFYLIYFVLMIGFKGEQYLPYKTILD